MGATAYDAIAANKRRSVLLIVVFTIVVLAVGWAIGQLYQYGPTGIGLAFIVVIIMTLGGYYRGDALALGLAGAQGPIQKTDSPDLWNAVENLCLTVGLPMPKVYLLPEEGINAFATGRDPAHASIAVTAGALQKLTRTELEGVLAHELSHIQNYDMRFMTLVAVLVGVIALLSNFATRSWMFGGNRRSNDREGGQLQAIFMLVSLVLLILAPIIGQLLKFAVSRKREYLADASAVLITRYPAGLAGALAKIAADGGRPLHRASGTTSHLYISNPFGSRGGLAKMFSTHPPLEDRIAALQRMS